MLMKFIGLIFITFFSAGTNFLIAQVKWVNVDSAFQPLPPNFHVYKTTDSLDGKPFIAYYAEAKLKDKNLDFTADTSYKRRLTPKQFYEKNSNPLLVVNGTFFSFTTNQNLNVVVKNGKLVSYNIQSIKGKGKDSAIYFYPMRSAIGIDKKRNADVAWLYTDSSSKYPKAFQLPLSETPYGTKPFYKLSYANAKKIRARFFDLIHTMQVDRKWKMQTAIGGGPVLVLGGIMITNEEEKMFTGKAINDKHPRTCMGYTKDGRLIIMVIQGRLPGIAEGATLTQQAQLLVALGCEEALNLDGGGSSCMLINGKETITPSDKEGQRAVPAVFIINNK